MILPMKYKSNPNGVVSVCRWFQHSFDEILLNRRRRRDANPNPSATRPADAGSGTETTENPAPSGLATSCSPNSAAKLFNDATWPAVSADELAPKFPASN